MSATPRTRAIHDGGAPWVVVAVLAASTAGCFFSPSLKNGGDLGDPCNDGSPCGDGLVCELSVCEPPDDASNPRVYGDFEAMYAATSPTTRLLSPGPQSFAMLGPDRLLWTGGVIDVSAGSVLTWPLGALRAQIARTDDEGWALFSSGPGRGVSLPDLQPIATGFFPGLPAGDRIAANETGELAWWASDGTGIHVLGPARDTPATTIAAAGVPGSMVIEPGGAIVFARDGELASPTGRPVGAHAEWVMTVHRPHGGPTLVTTRADVQQSPPTHLAVLEPDGRLTPLLTLPDPLHATAHLDAVDGRLYLSTPAGLFRSRSIVLP